MCVLVGVGYLVEVRFQSSELSELFELRRDGHVLYLGIMKTQLA
jgi:hypothetical protein